MSSFSGFPQKTSHLTSIPTEFFSELLPQIDNLEELKVCLYVMWYLSHQEGEIQFILQEDIREDTCFMKGLHPNAEAAQKALANGLERAVQRSFLLKAQIKGAQSSEVVYLLNSARGRAALASLEKGEWTPEEIPLAPVRLELEKPNIFRLYEENIGPLTPLIADTLRDAETNYNTAWIEEAIQIAVENNVRRWRYIEAILESWQKEGRNGTDRRDAEENRRRYLEGKYSQYIEH